MEEEDNKKSVQQNIIFYMMGSLIYYVCQWLMTVVIVRMSGYEDAGILSLAMTVTASPAIIGLFNIRNYQVSDIEGQYSNKTYIRSRAYTNLLSYTLCAAMVIVGGYNLKKAAVILIFMLFKVSEGLADVYYGIEQKWERMDYTGISMTVRGIGTITLFVVTFLLTESILLSVIAVSVFSFTVIYIYDRKMVKHWVKNEEKADWNEIKELLITCLPLAVVAFLNNFSINLPKMYLENYFGSEVMGYYNSVASPTIVVQLAAATIFAPLVPVLTTEYNHGNKKAFLAILKKIGILFFTLSGISLIGAKLLGHWGLALLFQDGIEPYVYLFLPTMGVSILIAINAGLFSLCTLLREIKAQYIIGAAGVIVSWVLASMLVKVHSMIGVVYVLIGTLVVQIAIQIILIAKRVGKM